MTPGDHLTAARLAVRLERAGVELVVRDEASAGLALSAHAVDPATLARVITPELREAIARAKPALLEILSPAVDPLPPLSRALSALVRADPAWSAIPRRALAVPSPDTRCVHCERVAEYRFMAITVHPACFVARCNEHVLELPAGVSCCRCPACAGQGECAPPPPPTPASTPHHAPPPPTVDDPLDAILGSVTPTVTPSGDPLDEVLSCV